MNPLTRTDPSLGMSIDEAAAYWALRHDRQDMAPADVERFESWLAASEANAQAFRKANGVWAVFDQADADPHLAALRQAALATGPEKKRWPRVAWGALAAGVAALALILSGQLGLGPAHPPADRVASLDGADAANLPRHATIKGQKRVVTLPDGTHVTLNTDTAITVAFTPGIRRVRLTRGQALFEVFKDHSRPFVVEAADRRITALGTVFEVRLDPGRMKVMLVEGRVVVDRAAGGTDTPDPRPTMLKPGQELVAELGVAQQIRAVDTGNELLWREGYVSFDDATLASAVAEMNRYTSSPVRLADGAVGQRRISGVFKTGDGSRFAALIGELLPVHVERQPDGSVVISDAPGEGANNKSSPAGVEN
ncbi:MAG: FecR domain-containing protein [Novosphingobium sp.]|nr:FecR domain-containing protein [Novosphingobium sp.]